MEKDLLESFANRFTTLSRTTGRRRLTALTIADVLERAEALKEGLRRVSPKTTVETIGVEVWDAKEPLSEILQALEVYCLEMRFFAFLGADILFMERAGCALSLLSEVVNRNYALIFNRSRELDLEMYGIMKMIYDAVCEGCMELEGLETAKSIFEQEVKKLDDVVERIKMIHQVEGFQLKTPVSTALIATGCTIKH